MGLKCRCAFMVDLGEICFRLPWWGKKNERFGKSRITHQTLLLPRI